MAASVRPTAAPTAGATPISTSPNGGDAAADRDAGRRAEAARHRAEERPRRGGHALPEHVGGGARGQAHPELVPQHEHPPGVDAALDDRAAREHDGQPDQALTAHDAQRVQQSVVLARRRRRHATDPAGDRGDQHAQRRHHEREAPLVGRVAHAALPRPRRRSRHR